MPKKTYPPAYAPLVEHNRHVVLNSALIDIVLFRFYFS